MNWIDRMNSNALKWHAEQNDIPIVTVYRCADCREDLVKLGEDEWTCENSFCESYMARMKEVTE